MLNSGTEVLLLLYGAAVRSSTALHASLVLSGSLIL